MLFISKVRLAYKALARYLDTKKRYVGTDEINYWNRCLRIGEYYIRMFQVVARIKPHADLWNLICGLGILTLASITYPFRDLCFFFGRLALFIHKAACWLTARHEFIPML